MPKVHHRKARKDYPQQGIVKGDMYYTWSIKLQRGGMVKRSKTYPRRSQLTMSEFLGTAYDISDSISAAEDVGGLRLCGEEIEQLRDETQEKLENMPEGLQQGPTGEMLQERIDQCEEWLQAVEDACQECDDFEPDEDSDKTEDEQRQENFNEARDGIDNPY